MKKYSKEQIDETRNHFKKERYAEIGVSIHGNDFSYYVLPKSLQPALPDFVFRMTGEPEDGYVFGISDSMPDAFRQYAVAHEFIEFTRIGIDTQGRCVEALRTELMLVPEDIKSDYINRRMDFFNNLVEYCKNQADFTPEDIIEMQQSLSKLESLSKL